MKIVLGNKERYDFSTMAVMVIEENRFYGVLLNNILKSYGIQNIHISYNTKEAFNELRTGMYDLLLVEYKIVPMNGVDFIKFIRKALKNGKEFIPSIMITGSSEEHNVLHARDSGCTEFLCKPLSSKTLIERILYCIEYPRNFIQSETYFGPDRRRKNSDFQGKNKRVNTPYESNEVPDGIDMDYILDQKRKTEIDWNKLNYRGR